MESAGIPTVVIGTGVFRDRLAAMRLPRTLVTHQPLGRPLGRPKDYETQRRYLMSALRLLESAREGGTMIDCA
jgi:hypothetical protein